MNDIQTKIWQRLGTQSKRALKRKKKNYGNTYFYNPRGDLLLRLANELNLSIEKVYNELLKIHYELTSDQD